MRDTRADEIPASEAGFRETKVEHTPSPWEVVNGLIYGQDTRLVAMIPRSDDARAVTGRGERQANLSLMAAAPDLLKQLIHARAFIPKNQPGLRASVNAAIAKAEGRE